MGSATHAVSAVTTVLTSKAWPNCAKITSQSYTIARAIGFYHASGDGILPGMARRRKADVKKTLLCATRFWSIGWREHDNRTATSSSGVRHVVRKQGFTTGEINRAERELIREGKLEVSGKKHGKTLRLTDAGNRVSCSSVRLAPWTDDQYPGAALTSRRRKRR